MDRPKWENYPLDSLLPLDLTRNLCGKILKMEISKLSVSLAKMVSVRPNGCNN